MSQEIQTVQNELLEENTYSPTLYLFDDNFEFPQDCHKFLADMVKYQDGEMKKNSVGMLSGMDTSSGLCNLNIVSDIESIVSRINNKEYVLDFDSLEPEIKKKLKKGIYKLGESRQVDGNLRAVLVDKAGQRVKDVTVKLSSNLGVSHFIGGAVITYMLKQINENLVAIQMDLNYKILTDRAKTIKSPFEKILMDIYQIQNKRISDLDMMNYSQITDSLERLLFDVKTDLDTTTEYIINHHKKKFGKTKMVAKYGLFVAEDLFYFTFYSSILIRMYEFSHNQEKKRYIENYVDKEMKKLACQNENSWSILDILQEYYPYNDKNRDCWYNLDKNIRIVNGLTVLTVAD